MTPVPTPTGNATCPPSPELTAGKIIALAAVNAINPCALAVLVVILLAIITHNPGRREKILLAGLAFSLSVFVFYLAYGLILVSLLSAVREVSSLQTLLTRGLGLVSIGIGLSHVREYLSPGGEAVLTGIPAGWRPRLGKALDRITSPLGAFVVGALVTLFVYLAVLVYLTEGYPMVLPVDVHKQRLLSRLLHHHIVKRHRLCHRAS